MSTNRQLLEACGKTLSLSPEEVIAHVVRGHNFRNEDEVIAQNVYRYRRFGTLPDYVRSYAESVTVTADWSMAKAESM